MVLYLLWVLSPTHIFGSNSFIKLVFNNPFWAWWYIFCWDPDEHTDLAHSSSYIAPHFSGYNNNRHRRVFLFPHSLNKFQSLGILTSFFDWTLWMHCLLPFLLQPVCWQLWLSKGSRASFGPDGFPSSAAVECLGKGPEENIKSTSTIKMMASKLQLSSAILAATVMLCASHSQCSSEMILSTFACPLSESSRPKTWPRAWQNGSRFSPSDR